MQRTFANMLLELGRSIFIKEEAKNYPFGSRKEITGQMKEHLNSSGINLEKTGDS